MDGSVRAGDDIHSLDGRATQAKNGAAFAAVKCLTGNQQLTPEQRVLELREASKHPKAGVHSKRAGLTDLCEEEPLRHMISQSNKLIGAAQKRETEKA